MNNIFVDSLYYCNQNKEKIMSDEIKITNNNDDNRHETKCLCQSKGFRKFLIIALGTFVGVYSALCLFAALHRPPMMPPCAFGRYAGMGIEQPCPYKVMHHHHFKNHERQENPAIQKKVKPAPFDSQKFDD